MRRISAMRFVSCASLNSKSPSTSLPTISPTARNASNTGTPIFSEIFVEKMEAIIKRAKKKNIIFNSKEMFSLSEISKN